MNIQSDCRNDLDSSSIEAQRAREPCIVMANVVSTRLRNSMDPFKLVKCACGLYQFGNQHIIKAECYVHIFTLDHVFVFV